MKVTSHFDAAVLSTSYIRLLVLNLVVTEAGFIEGGERIHIEHVEVVVREFFDLVQVDGPIQQVRPVKRRVVGNNWGLGGLKEDSELEQWEDFQAGINFGWKLNRSIGVFFEGEYTKFWDSRIYNGSVGFNITLR